jgi:hypothetical protein
MFNGNGKEPTNLWETIALVTRLAFRAYVSYMLYQLYYRQGVHAPELPPLPVP